jgi:hypothetical protein
MRAPSAWRCTPSPAHRPPPLSGVFVAPESLRQRPSQADINSGSTIVFRGVGTGPTLFGHDDNLATWLSQSDTPSEDRAEQYHADDHPAHGGGQILIGPLAHHCRTHAHHRPARCNTSLSREAVWWRGGGDPLTPRRSGAFYRRHPGPDDRYREDDDHQVVSGGPLRHTGHSLVLCSPWLAPEEGGQM